MSARKTSTRQGKQPGTDTFDAPSPSFPRIVQHTSYSGSNQDGRRGRNASTATDATRTEAAWAEMQNTLEEVELSAAGGASAFSAEHGKALEDLRKAQISLAQAWARSEAEDDGAGETLGQDADERLRGTMASGQVLGNERQGATSTGKGRGRQDSAASAKAPSLEEETNNDIFLARKRREANDRYFEKVNKGVLDVVEKLDVVAKKMKGVELEAQDLWESRSSLETDSAG